MAQARRENAVTRLTCPEAATPDTQTPMFNLLEAGIQDYFDFEIGGFKIIRPSTVVDRFEGKRMLHDKVKRGTIDLGIVTEKQLKIVEQ